MRQPIWTSLRRITSSGLYVPEIDGLRFIAIASVLFYHLAMMSLMGCGLCFVVPPVTTGLAMVFHMDRGVPIFFAISGLVLGLPFAEQYIAGGRQVKLKRYFLRRITRLEPPYIINLLVRFPLVVAFKHVPAWIALPHLIASLFYLHWLIYGGFPMIHQPSWSLEIEVQFYLVAPLLAALFFARKTWVRRLCLLVAIIGFGAVRAHVPYGNWTRLSLSLGCYAQYFLAGLLMADGFLTVLPRLKSSWLWDLGGIPLWCSLFLISDPAAGYCMPLLLFAAFTSAFKGRLLNRFFRNPFVTTVGGMCYSLYLTHSLVMEGCYRLFARIHPGATYGYLYLAGVVIVLPLILALGTVFYVLIERPCMDRDWPKKLSRYVTGRFTVQTSS